MKTFIINAAWKSKSKRIPFERKEEEAGGVIQANTNERPSNAIREVLNTGDQKR